MAGSVVSWGYEKQIVDDNERVTLFGIDEEGVKVEVGWNESIYAEIVASEANSFAPPEPPEE